MSEKPSAPGCFLCGAPMRYWRHVPVDYRKTARTDHAHHFWCDHCDYGRIHPIPAGEEIGSFYAVDDYYTHTDDGSEEVPIEARSPLDRVREHLAYRLDKGRPLVPEQIDADIRARGLTHARICDMGCGGGGNAVALANMGHEVTAVEVDENAVSARYADTLRFMRGTAEQLPEGLERDHFDVVVLSHVLEHTRLPDVALKNLCSLLKPGGVLAIEVPNNACMAQHLRGPAWAQCDVPRHLHFFTDRSLERSVVAAGLQPRGVRFAHFLRQFSNDWIAIERNIWKQLHAEGVQPTPMPPAPDRRQAWEHLLRSFGAAKRERYDSVSITAQRPQR